MMRLFVEIFSSIGSAVISTFCSVIVSPRRAKIIERFIQILFL
jgi:hypothetical protein